MSQKIVYVVRGKCRDTGRKYKLVRGQLKQIHEARGEDQFDSVFYAIHAGVQAATSWDRIRCSIVFNAEPVMVPDIAVVEGAQ